MEHWVDGQLSKAQARKCIFAATLGCGLEFYDFLTFAFFAIQIGHTFFPSSNAYLSLMGCLRSSARVSLAGRSGHSYWADMVTASAASRR